MDAATPLCTWQGKGKKVKHNVASRLRAVTAAAKGTAASPSPKCKHLPSIRVAPVLAALAKLAVGELAYCDVRTNELWFFLFFGGGCLAAAWAL